MTSAAGKKVIINGTLVDGKLNLDTLEMDNTKLKFGATGLQSISGNPPEGDELTITQALATAKVDNHIPTTFQRLTGVFNNNTRSNAKTNASELAHDSSTSELAPESSTASIGGTRRCRNKKRMSRRKRASRRR